MPHELKLLRVKKLHIYDVFIGDGWSNWSRVLFQKDKTIHIDGIRLSPSDHAAVNRTLRELNNHGPKANVPLAHPQDKKAA